MDSPGVQTAPSYAPPDASLFTRDAPRFELSAIQQKVPGGVPDVFEHLELGEDRFALVYLRAIDADGKGVRRELDVGFRALAKSLEEDGDPGLAANLALEALCSNGFADRLECAVLAFEPEHMTMTPYNSGCGNALWWVSHEEGRTLQVERVHSPLERKLLRQSGDHFVNGRPVELASGDLFVLVSAGYAGRGAGGYFDGVRELLDTLNAHLGEEPLRVVTLAKNAFWSGRAERPEGAHPPVGDVTIAAARAVPPGLAEALPQPLEVSSFKARRFDVSALRAENDVLFFEPLHADRHVLIWLSPKGVELPQEKLQAARSAILRVLDRPDHGDNENPRLAGREALAALSVPAGSVRLAVIQLFNAFGSVKYFCSGWKQPVSLGPRGLRDAAGVQQFDGGGTTGVADGGRLFFPGGLEYECEVGQVDALAAAWRGGRASRLYEAIADHWKTKKLERALLKLALAAASDGARDVSGMALVG
jgi:hypothetical protein